MYAKRIIDVAELVSVIQRENLGEPHAVLAGGERYFSPRFQTEPPGVADDELRDALALVQYARVEHYAWISNAAGPSAALVAAIGRAAILLTRTGDQVTLAGTDPDRLVESLIRQLPNVPAGRGESISVRVADYTPPGAASDRDVPGFLLHKPSSSARSQEARQLDVLLQVPRLGGAKLYTARRDQSGTRRRAQDWITVLDLTRHGRWVLYAKTGRGERAVNALPGTPQVLTAKLSELHTSLN